MFNLYHGSKTKIETCLKPSISYELKNWVYATDDYYYALVRSGAFDLTKFMVREEYEGPNKPYELCELYSGAFEELFDRPGYIYIVSPDLFEYRHGTEWVSDKYIRIDDTIYIPNVWEELNKNIGHYKLIRNEDSEEYWKNVRGGREGYLKRKKEALSNILRAR